MTNNPTPTQQGKTPNELCPWCAKPPDVHDKNNLGIRYLGCPTRGCTGRSLGFIIDHLWNTRAVAGPRGDAESLVKKWIATLQDESRVTDEDAEDLTFRIIAFAATSPAESATSSSDAWHRWFQRLGEKATAEIVNATANLVTEELAAAERTRVEGEQWRQGMRDAAKEVCDACDNEVRYGPARKIQGSTRWWHGDDNIPCEAGGIWHVLAERATSAAAPAESDSCSHWREGNSDHCVLCGDDLGPTTGADVAAPADNDAEQDAKDAELWRFCLNMAHANGFESITDAITQARLARDGQVDDAGSLRRAELPSPAQQALQIVTAWRAVDGGDDLLIHYIKQAIEENRTTTTTKGDR